MVKTQLLTKLKQTNLENRLHISTEIPKEGFNDTVFQNFIDESKHQFQYFLFLCSIYVIFMLLLRMIFFITFFALFPNEFGIFQSLVTRFLCKSILERKTSLRRFGGGGYLACHVLKFVSVHRFFHNQESFSRRI